MPDTQITGPMIDAALEAFDAADITPLTPRSDCIRAALEAALSGHVVVQKGEKQ